jgi:hypothetical protein
MSFIKRMLRGYLTFLCLLTFVSLLIFIFHHIEWEYIAAFVAVSLFAYDVGGNEKEGPISKQITKCIVFFIKIFPRREH